MQRALLAGVRATPLLARNPVHILGGTVTFAIVAQTRYCVVTLSYPIRGPKKGIRYAGAFCRWPSNFDQAYHDRLTFKPDRPVGQHQIKSGRRNETRLQRGQRDKRRKGC